MADLIGELVAIVGENGVLRGDDLSARPASWIRPEPCRAKAIVRPASTDEVSAVMQLCHADEILLSLERMNEIEELDESGCTMTVGAGVVLETVQERAADADLMFPVDFGASSGREAPSSTAVSV